MADQVGVLGYGRFGHHLVHSLRQIGLQVHIYQRGKSLRSWATNCGVLCLACRDDQVPDLVQAIKPLPLANKTVLMHSGATPLDVLQPLADAGANIGKFHPLMAFTRRVDAPIPKGTPFAIEGNIAALVKPWVQAWECLCYTLKGEQWQQYHLAAVTAANFLPLFIRAGSQTLEPFTTDKQSALDWLAPLVRQTLEGALDGDNDLPFSGPAVRGDEKILRDQETIWAQLDPEMAELYRLASQKIRTIAQTKKRK